MNARLDVVALLHALDAVAETRPRFLGAVVSLPHAVELVFDESTPLNLLTIFLDDGEVVLGGVTGPETYARAGRRWRPGVRR